MFGNMPLKKILQLCAIVSLCLIIQQLQAAAFAIKEQNVTHLGYAYAGTAALAEDASIGYSNPAGLSNLLYDQIVVGAINARCSSRLAVNSASNNLGNSVSGDTNIKINRNAVLPNVHLAKRWSDTLVFGFNISSPFALKTEYDSDSIVRYVATKSEIKSINFSPSVAYALNDKLSLGVGLDALYGKVWLFSNCIITTEGHLNSTGDGWGYGYHVGLFYKLIDQTKVGLAYHSRFNIKASGDTDALNLTAPQASAFSGTLKLPDRVTYSIYHQYNEQWAGMGDIEWVHWKRLTSIQIDYNNNTYSKEQLNFNNSYRIALGAHYTVNDHWGMKMGLAYEKSPVNNDNRIIRIPDADRYWLSVGAKYQYNKRLLIDVGYAYLFFKDGTVNQSGIDGSVKTAAVRNQAVQGKFKDTNASVMGIQLTWNFV